MNYTLYRAGPGPNAKTVLLPNSRTWLEDAIAATQERKRRRKAHAEWSAEQERKERETRERAREALRGDTVEIPEALFRALLDAYYAEGYGFSDGTLDIIETYLEDSQ